MEETIYEIDTLLWSERQAELLGRLSRGEAVGGEIDWDHVIEEVRDVGRDSISAVEALLTRAMTYMLKCHGWPDGPVAYWEGEAHSILGLVGIWWAPSMHARVSVAELFERAKRRLGQYEMNGRAPRPLPVECPYRLDDLIEASDGARDFGELLLARISSEPPIGIAR